MVKYKTKRGVEKVRLYVGTNDISLGRRGSASNCAVAIAATRNFGK